MRFVVALLGRIPPRWSERFGRALGRLAHRFGWRRQVVRRQIARAFPKQTESWIESTALACFEHLGQEMVVLTLLSRRGTETVRDWFETIEGIELLREAFDEGKGIVMVSGHFGNWELAGSALAALGYPTDVVMQGLKNRHLNRYVVAFRRRLGMELIDRRAAWDRTLERLRAGRVVGFVADQDARERGLFVPFFGQPASTHRAPALLALRAGAPLFVGGAYRLGAGRYRGFVVRLKPPEGVGIKEQVRGLTRLWTAELERRIRVSPEQYFWHHKRWKTQPVGTVFA